MRIGLPELLIILLIWVFFAVAAGIVLGIVALSSRRGVAPPALPAQPLVRSAAIRSRETHTSARFAALKPAQAFDSK